MEKGRWRNVGLAGVLQLLFLLFGVALEAQEIPRIDAKAAYTKYKAGRVILVDAMNARTYRKYHILGAISLPGDGTADLRRIEKARLPIPRDREILVYCD